MPQFNQPLVSIITVVYNNSKHIRGAIESVLSQDYPRIEHIVIDGGSTDGTKEFLESKGLQVIHQEGLGKGRGSAFHLAISKISADAYIFFSPDGNETRISFAVLTTWRLVRIWVELFR